MDQDEYSQGQQKRKKERGQHPGISTEKAWSKKEL